MPLGHPYVYHQSPFLPNVEWLSIEEALFLINEKHFPPPMAVAQVIIQLGHMQYIDISAHRDFLMDHFECDQEKVLRWLLGYTIPSRLVTGAHVEQIFGVGKFKEILPDDEDDGVSINLNQYHLNLLPRVISSLNHSSSGLAVFDLVQANPLYVDSMFFAGLIASKINYKALLSNTNTLRLL